MCERRWTSTVENWLEASERHAGRAAVSDGQCAWSHRELRARALAWAASIAARTAPGDRVAIVLPHRADTIAATLGVLSAGRTLLHIDARQDARRTAEQLAHAEATLLLADLAIAGWNGHRIAIPDTGAMDPTEPRRPQIATLQYTSGSTSDPRAVIWSHATLSRAARHLQQMFAFTPDDRHALLTPLSVASALAQVMSVLAAGGALRLCDANGLHANLRDRPRADGITTIQTIPSLFRMLARSGALGGNSLRAIKLGGEPVTPLDARLFVESAPDGAILINGLGITEAGFNVCWRRFCKRELEGVRELPMGRAPDGVELSAANGELLVASPDLADGYWRDTEATALRFTDLPGRPGWRQVRTGDLAKQHDDGNWSYQGRVDDQVKIRGTWVNAASVISALIGLAGVRDAGVLVTEEDHGARLRVFIVPAERMTSSEAAWREPIGRTLAHLVGSPAFDIVDELPRQPGGKLDRRALAARTEVISGEQSFRKPETALEHTLQGLFARVLPRRPFGIDESFFELGGDSLAAAALSASLRRVLDMDLPLHRLAANPSVAALASYIEADGPMTSEPPLVLLSNAPHADALSLFAWPGAGSDILALADLARHLGSGLALYGIQHRGADGRRSYDLTVGQIATRALPLIRRVQPRGPYRLCGSSFGGLAALQVAADLTEAGEDVSFVGLLDSYAPAYPRKRRDLSLRERLALWQRELRPIGRRDDPGVWNLLRGMREKWTRAQASLSVRSSRPEGPLLPVSTRYLHLQAACFMASRGFSPPRIRSPIHLFRAEPLPECFYEADRTLGWGTWYAEQLHVHEVPGRHGEHVREPHVRTLAAQMKELLAPQAPPLAMASAITA